MCRCFSNARKSFIRGMARAGLLAVVSLLISIHPAGEYVWFISIKNW